MFQEDSAVKLDYMIKMENMLNILERGSMERIYMCLTMGGGVKEKEIKYIDEKVYYLGDLRCHYGHFLIDEASRLWGILGENADVRVVCFLALEQMPKWLLEFFEYVGLPQSRLLILKRPTKFTEVLFYTPAYISGKYISNQYKNIFNYVADNVSKRGIPKKDINEVKLYLSRSNLHKIYRSFGERVIEKILRDNGFEILHPECMTLAEQVEKYMHASIIISTNGTLSHNVLFASKAIKLVILDRAHSEFGINNHQAAISLLFETPPRIVRCSTKNSNHAISYMGITEDMRKMFEEYGIVNKHVLRRRIESIMEYIGYGIFFAMSKLKHIIIK